MRVGIIANATATSASVSCGQCETSFDVELVDGVIPGFDHQCGADASWQIVDLPVTRKPNRRARFTRWASWLVRRNRYRLASFIAGFDVTA